MGARATFLEGAGLLPARRKRQRERDVDRPAPDAQKIE
jgi:hypothetical protein